MTYEYAGSDARLRIINSNPYFVVLYSMPERLYLGRPPFPSKNASPIAKNDGTYPLVAAIIWKRIDIASAHKGKR